MDRSSDAEAKSLASGEMSRRESVRRLGGLLGGGALVYFGVGCRRTLIRWRPLRFACLPAELSPRSWVPHAFISGNHLPRR